MRADAELTPWDRFVLRHRRPGNLVVHFVSAILFFGSPLAALVFKQPWLLLGFFSSGLLGAAGHHVFADGVVSVREATVATEVPYFVLVMFYKIARGTYATDIERALSKVKLEEPAPSASATSSRASGTKGLVDHPSSATDSTAQR
ncbi:MAG TPA: hypothetical protein VM580_23070 [Labilithrix sp.]|jgi:hypothetical protein|nr:hypothetical protein [Labilithrix sp.]